MVGLRTRTMNEFTSVVYLCSSFTLWYRLPAPKTLTWIRWKAPVFFFSPVGLYLPLIHLTFNQDFKYLESEADILKKHCSFYVSHLYFQRKPFPTPPVHLISPPCVHFHASAELFFVSLSYALTRGFFSISSSLSCLCTSQALMSVISSPSRFAFLHYNPCPGVLYLEERRWSFEFFFSFHVCLWIQLLLSLWTSNFMFFVHFFI